MNMNSHPSHSLFKAISQVLLLVLCLSLFLSCAGIQKTPEVLPVLPDAGDDTGLEFRQETYAADPWHGRTDLIEPPGAKPARPLLLSGISVKKESNGLTLIGAPSHDLPQVDVALTVKAGMFDDPEVKAGLSMLLAETVTRGAKKQSGEAIHAAIEQKGGSLFAQATYETIEIRCRALANDLALCLSLLADVAMNATFPNEELEKARDLLVGVAVRQVYDHPSALAGEHVMHQLFGDLHPHGLVITEKSLENADSKSVLTFYHHYFTPGAATLSVAGDFDDKTLSSLVSEHFGKWKKPTPPERPLPKVPEPCGRQILLVDKPGLNQTQIRIAHLGISGKDADSMAVLVMNAILGDAGFSSRLMKTIRSDKGKTYNIRSSFEMNAMPGAFLISTFTRNHEVVSTLEDTLGEIDRYRQEGPTEEELRRVKSLLTGEYPMTMQEPVKQADAIERALRLGFDLDYVRNYALLLEAVTLAEVKEAAEKHLQTDPLTIVLVGDGDTLAPALTAKNFSFTRIDWQAPISQQANP